MLKTLLKSILGLCLLTVVLVFGLVFFMPGIHLSSLTMILNVMAGTAGDTPEETLIERLQLEEGWSVSVYARGIANPRLLLTTPEGRLLVSSPRSGEVLQISDADGDGAADGIETLLEGKHRPQGLAMQGGYLYVGESDKVGRIAYDDSTGTVSGDYQVVIDNLTDDGNHWSKSLDFDDQGRLYLAQGSTCNVCEEADVRRATIMRFAADGSDGEIFATGLRNSVGLAFAPWNGELYATDNGRDLLGDDYPVCELNHIVQGGFYGWPYLNGDNRLDPDYGAGHEKLQTTAKPPAHDFAPHNAPLGIHFAQGMERTALVALHGSWNRSTPDGYKVVALHWAEDGSISSRDFLWGFEKDADIIGRPVDISGDNRGGFFISDDYARVIYRVSRGEATADKSARAMTPQAARQQQESVDQALASAGARIYSALPCGDCHDATALTPVPLENLAARYNAEALAEFFLTPTPPMPQFDLNQEQRTQLAHYLLSLE
jgi:glucose/arabinose dehydrogenase